jgi:uridine phosphorylase
MAQELIEEPKMFNHHRGLWGYTGRASHDGELLTIQATGMGGPSAAIVLEELIELGARRLVRTGSCGALDDGLALGELVVAGEALAEDGASRALGADGRADADPELAARLGGLAGLAAGMVVSTDLFYAADAEAEGEARARWRAAGARAVEMECAVLFTLAALRGVTAGAVLAVSDELAGDEDRERIADDVLSDAARRMGEIAVAALSP